MTEGMMICTSGISENFFIYCLRFFQYTNINLTFSWTFLDMFICSTSLIISSKIYQITCRVRQLISKEVCYTKSWKNLIQSFRSPKKMTGELSEKISTKYSIYLRNTTGYSTHCWCFHLPLMFTSFLFSCLEQWNYHSHQQVSFITSCHSAFW